jgi:hypothetical protein
LLPAFTPGVPALRILAIGALLMAGATLPGYALLGLGKGLRTLPWAAAAVVVSGLLIFSVAASAPRATSVAMAAAAGQGCFAVLVLILGARELTLGAEWRALVLATLVPAAWAVGLTALLLAVGGNGWTAALWRSLALSAGYAPLAWWLGRDLGLSQIVRAGRIA